MDLRPCGYGYLMIHPDAVACKKVGLDNVRSWRILYYSLK